MSTAFQQIKLPPKVRPGQPVKADEHNQLIDVLSKLLGSLKYVTLQPSADIGVKQGPNGTTAFIKNKRRGSSSPIFPEFYSTIIPRQSDPSQYAVRIEPGSLVYINANATEAEHGVSGYVTPRMNGVPLDADAESDPAGPPEPLNLPSLASFVYIRAKTTADGAPKFGDGDVTIEAFSEPKKAIHHVRPSPTSGEEEGEYFLLILETESDGAAENPKPKVKRRITGNRFLPNQLIEITNIGGKREWYQGYLPGPEDKHEIRSAEQLDGEGSGLTPVAIIKPLAGAEDAVPPVTTEDGQVVTPGKPAVPAEKEGPTIKWRFCSQRATRPQLQVKESPDKNGIIFQGNDVSTTVEVKFGTSLVFDDGFFTEGFGGEDLAGWWGTVIYQTGGGLPLGRKDFKAGSLVAIYTPGSGGAWNIVPGTEQAPGAVNMVTDVG